MNIVVIDDSGVSTFKTWHKAVSATGLKKEEFTQVGQDYVATLTGDSYEIQKDIRLLENVAAQKMFTKNKLELPDIAGLVTLFMVFLLFVK